jgi:RES domain-containing protein
VRRFLINEPPDDWPDLVDLPAPEPDAALDGLIKRLESTSRGDDPAAFELACCDALAHLSLLVTYLGGHAQPDGYADAELGVLGYRVMIECKTAAHAVTHPSAAEEAGKFLDAFHGDVAVLLGPDFFGWADILAELKTHRVTALSVPDLVTLLELRADPLELRTILVPGFADDAVNYLVWERRHGKLKRILTVAAFVQREGWNAQHVAAAQHAAAAQHVRADAARLTVDAAMLMVDASLAAAGSTQGCSREEVEAAFAHLTDPMVKAATWLDSDRSAIGDDRSAIVILSAPTTAAMSS